jgi:hypothetical protein
MSAPTLNPLPMLNAAGTFAITASGLIQGDVMADPASRNWLAGGFLDPAAANPLWPGCGITETVLPLSGAGLTAPISDYGPKLDLATQIAQGAGNLSGFVTSMQAFNAVNTPQSPVPLIYPGMSANFFRLGSKARIILPLAASLVSLEGGVTSAPLSWDFINQQLVPYVAAYAGATQTSAAYSSSTGQLAMTFSAAPAVVAGDYVAVTGYSGVNVGLNGTWAVLSNAANVVTLQAPSGLTGTSATPTGGAIAGGGGAITGLQVLKVNIGGSITVVTNLNSTSGAFATWNYQGNAAICLLN